MRIIGITGKAGSGKDTAADFLVADHGFVKRGFADPLYEEVAVAFGVTVEWLRERTRKEVPQKELALCRCMQDEFYLSVRGAGANGSEPRSPRWILQKWGTEYRRGQSDQYWLERMTEYLRAEESMASYPNLMRKGVVIPDVRFENEAIWVRQNGGTVLHLIRPGIVPVNAHASEAGVTMHANDAMLYNGGTLEGLRDRVAYEVRRG